MAEQEEQNLSAWRLNLKRFGKPHWLVMYKTFLGASVSNIPRFYKALNMYGEWPMFEAIIATSTATIEGDPLNYCLKVAHSKWKEQQQDEDEEAQLKESLEDIKKQSQAKNEALANKLKKRRNE